MSDNPNRAHSPTHVNQTEISLISNNARNIVDIHVTEDSKLKGTQHTAKWQYRTTFFKMNEWLKSIRQGLVRAIGKILHMKFS